MYWLGFYTKGKDAKSKVIPRNIKKKCVKCSREIYFMKEPEEKPICMNCFNLLPIEEQRSLMTKIFNF